jgi:ubiquinone/menaquinone biosynthesis C-methylase UbiE
METGHLSAQYDQIATDYQRTKESPLREHVEAWSFRKMLGSVKGLRVLDLACGDGFYTRRIKDAGAAEVIGIDVSAEMIQLAEQQEVVNPLGLEYLCADALDLPDLGQFDLVSAAYLLHYASSATKLETMCQQVAGCLRSQGRLIAINENPDQSQDSYAGYSQYGFNKSVVHPRRDGSPIHYSMISGRNLIRFDAYYYSSATYEAALRAAGFRTIEWRSLELDPAGVETIGADYWEEYLANPPVTGLLCELS